MDNTKDRIKLILGGMAEKLNDLGDCELVTIDADDAYWLINKVEEQQEKIEELSGNNIDLALDYAYLKTQNTEEISMSTVMRFEDGTYLGLCGKTSQLSDAIKFNGDWERDIHLKNHPISYRNEKYKVKNVKMSIQILD